MADFAQEEVVKKQHGLMLGQSFMHPPGTPSPAAATPTVPMPGFNQTLGQGIAMTSGSERFSSLGSSPHSQSFVGHMGGTLSVGWSEARHENRCRHRRHA